MPEATFTFRVEDSLKSAFTETAKKRDRTAAQLLRDFMREYVAQEKSEIEYDTWFRQKVEAGEKAFREGRFITQEEATARAKQRREKLMGRVDRQ